MKLPSDKLYNLIHSMTAAEKRFLKIHFSVSKSHLTELFDFVNAMENYEEHLVKENFSNNLISKNLKVYKVQLIELILKSQVSFHAKRKIRSHVRILLEEVDLLIDKGLCEQAMQRIKKAIDICVQNNETSLLVTCFHQRDKMERIIGRRRSSNQIENFKMLQQALSTLNTEIKLNLIVGKMEANVLQKHTSPTERAEIEALFKDIKNPQALQAGSNLSAFFVDKINIYREQDQEKQISLQEQVLKKFKAKGFNFVYDQLYRWEMLNNLFENYAQIGHHEKVNYCLKTYQNLIPYSKVHKDNMYIPALSEMKYLFFNGLEHSTIAQLAGIAIDEVDSDLIGDNVFCARFYVFKMLMLLMGGNASEAKLMLSELQSATRSKHPHLNIILDMIEMIDHFESNNYKTVNYMLSGYHRKRKRGKEFTPFTLGFFEFMKAMVKQPQQQVDHIQKMTQLIKNNREDPVYKIWDYYNLCDWIHSLDQAYKFLNLQQEKKKLKRTHQHTTFLKDYRRQQLNATNS